MAARKPGAPSVVGAVEGDLKVLGDVASSALAASALALARELDNPHNPATSKAACARALREVMDRLRELAPPKEKADKLDDLAAKRAARRGGSAA